ncbi:glycoside hydrolase family 13 protein [Spirochaeta isovalerica]|uniref:Alpha-glucosidase n=1 Tax=Spirochaeta isovalerica TaxID=150 RepID=A0A841RBU4_9SPIO|nr:glycoside hydrolase family 13 protein [Spirochaeta isovalerica]MBB6481445.1 alpha-glucosidase [Spirochaeta isovalerica]
MADWKESIHSEVNNVYMSNPAARPGEETTISFRVFKEAPVRSAELRVVICGHSERISMAVTEEDSLFKWWTAKLYISQEEMIHWHFLLHTDEGELFYTRKALETVNPTEDNDFTLLPAFQSPDWIKSAVFYQIFPDRFRNGDPSCGRTTGEYEFDGGSPRVMDWTDEPLEFAEGRCMDFFNGDLAGIREKIPYLKDLGVTAVFLNPIFRAHTAHRYDCTDYFHVDEALGGDEALAELSRALHEEGMKLIVDVSINHTGSNHVWFTKAQADPGSREARYYFPDGKGGFECWWDVPTLPQLNYNSPELRETIIDGDDSLVKHWLKDPWKIDGWRFDVANQVGRRKESQLGFGIWRDVRKAVKSVNPKAYIVGEHWEDTIAYHLGDQWDGAMNYFACGSPLRRWAGEAVRFEAEGPDYPPRRSREYTGFELEQMIRQHYDRIPSQVTGLQLNVFDTHDIHRFHNHEDLFDWDIYRGMIFLQFLLPGTPNIWYGDEVGLKGHALSVEGCRYPMEWREENWDSRFVKLYGTMARLKRDEPALHTGGYKVLYRDNTSFVFARFDREKGFLAILNKSGKRKTLNIPVSVLGNSSRWEDLFTSERFQVEKGILTLNLTARENSMLWADFIL